ncbi:hypothetical protein MKZ38_005549 [Zalerion maritima]|uniref:NAD(P)-binding domain-containing protein n=1 Tax=Zalerion maritima TaxID=339359 RepID=A0AAD5WQ84_9PEZI|nr:hypothetical protein MKZ38_005549 [Zalerion maritima]
MAGTIKNVAVFGASGNFGVPITNALLAAGHKVTAFSRPESTAAFPSSLPVVRVSYTAPDLAPALAGQDAVVCVIGPAGIASQVAITEAAVAAGVKRFIVNDYGWGPGFGSLPEFNEIGSGRQGMWDCAKENAQEHPAFSWSGIAIGNPIDWALPRFPTFGFDIASRKAIIYDKGTETWTGTTLEGIGQAVAGTLQHLDETAGRTIKVRSIKVCQNELLAAFEEETGEKWEVTGATTEELIERGRAKKQAGNRGWILDLMVGQILEEGVGRGVLVDEEGSDNGLVGVRTETPLEVVKKALKIAENKA